MIVYKLWRLHYGVTTLKDLFQLRLEGARQAERGIKQAHILNIFKACKWEKKGRLYTAEFHTDDPEYKQYQKFNGIRVVTTEFFDPANPGNYPLSSVELPEEFVATRNERDFASWKKRHVRDPKVVAAREASFAEAERQFIASRPLSFWKQTIGTDFFPCRDRDAETAEVSREALDGDSDSSETLSR